MFPLESPKWQGWVIDDDEYLVDPAGNKYRPEDMQLVFWCRQAWQSKAGRPSQIRFMREHLEQLVRESRQTFVIEIRRQVGARLVSVETVMVGGIYAPADACPKKKPARSRRKSDVRKRSS